MRPLRQKTANGLAAGEKQEASPFGFVLLEGGSERLSRSGSEERRTVAEAITAL